MRNKTMLTIDDLVRFCEEQKFAKFSSEETGYKLAVKVPTVFESEDSVDENHRGMQKVKIKIFHTGINRNKSRVSKESAERAMKTIPDRPVLGAIHQLDDGSWDFEGHEIKTVANEETGEKETIYIESQIGSFSSEPAFWEHDDELDKDFVCAYAYIAEDYTKAVSILKNKNGTKNSCELVIEELSYDGREKVLDLENFYVNASTFLGSHNDGTEIGEGMQGSRADIVDFSEEHNSILIDLQTRVSNLESKLNQVCFNDKNSTKGGNLLKFEELLKKYNITKEEIDFDYEGLQTQPIVIRIVLWKIKMITQRQSQMQKKAIRIQNRIQMLLNRRQTAKTMITVMKIQRSLIVKNHPEMILNLMLHQLQVKRKRKNIQLTLMAI